MPAATFSFLAAVFLLFLVKTLTVYDLLLLMLGLFALAVFYSAFSR